MWSEIGYLKILLWVTVIGSAVTVIGSAYWIFRSIVFGKKPKRTPAATNSDNKRDSRINLPASGANPANKVTVRIGVPPKSSANQTIRISMPPKREPDPPMPSSKQTIRISLPPKKGQAPVDPYETVTSPIVSTQSTVDEPKGKKYGITGPAPLPIADPGILPAPIPVHLGIPQVVFRMRILQQLWEEQLVSEGEYQRKKAEILRNL